MAGPHHQSHHSLFDLDTRGADVPDRTLAGTHAMISEMMETVVRSKDKIATSKALMIEVDRLLARR